MSHKIPVKVGRIADNGLNGMPGVGIISSGQDMAVKHVHMKFASLKIAGRRFDSRDGVSGCLARLVGS